ncbi:MAG: VWA-like domain-containing protein [Bacteroidota bacterium]
MDDGIRIEHVTTEEIDKEVTNACIRLMMTEPFYGHFFQGVAREIHRGVPTLAIGTAGNGIKLHVNPLFWRRVLTTDKLQYGLVKHEILHVVFKHIFRAREFTNAKLFNIACDLVVNQYILTTQLPEDHVHLQLFPELQLAPEMHADYYYEKLLSLYQQLHGEKPGNGDASSDGNPAHEGKNQGKPSTQSGEPGKQDGSSRPQTPTPNPNSERLPADEDAGTDSESSAPGQDDGSAPKTDKPISEDNLKKLMGEGNSWQDSHALWKELEELPASIRDLVEQMVDQSIENTLSKMKDRESWGKLPAGLRGYLADFEQSRRPVVNWKRVLRMFAATSAKTYLKNTIRRPSRRYGTTPGIKVRRRQKLLVAIDTSGSVGDEELRAFFAEIYHIYKRGSEVMVVECDADIHASYLYKGRAPTEITGRGGTNFTPPIAYANSTYHPDAIVYFTDAYAPPPTVSSRCPLLWLVSAEGADPGTAFFDDLPGRKVKMQVQ